MIQVLPIKLEVKPLSGLRLYSRLQIEGTFAGILIPGSVPFIEPILEGVPVLQRLDRIQFDGIRFRDFREEFQQVLVNLTGPVFLRNISGDLPAYDTEDNVILRKPDFELILTDQGRTNLDSGYHRP